MYYERFRDKDHSIFMAGTTYTFYKEANKLRGKSHWGISFPLHAHLHLFHVGTSSFTFEIRLRDYKTGMDICTAVLTFVFVDFKTRKPVPFPAWFTDKCADVPCLRERGPPQRLKTPPMPPRVFKYETKALFSDIDFNNHVNQSVYVRWCTDAGAEAASKGFYRDFNQDIGVYDIKEMKVKYIGEGMINDEFLVLTWQDETMPRTIHFLITKQGRTTFVGRFSYEQRTVYPSQL